MKIIDYCLVEGRSSDVLEKRVKKLLATGWQPLGSAVMDSQGFCQTMVLYE